MRRVVIPENRATKAAVVALCTWEVAAITTGAIPTITALNRRWPALGVVLVAALAVHFSDPRPTT